MSRSVLKIPLSRITMVGLSGVGLSGLGLSGSALGQDLQNPVTADEVLGRAALLYGPARPAPKCTDAGDDEIVVCAQLQEQSQFRVQSSTQLDPDSEAAKKDEIPRAPNFAAPPCKPSLLTLCPKLGGPSEPALMIDLSALPEAPAGSDADMIARGEKPIRCEK